MYNYDFDTMLKGIGLMINISTRDDFDPRHRDINMNKATDTIKKELNKFFPDNKCDGVIYTENTDSDFFGIVVKPVGWDVNIIFDDTMDYHSFNKYRVEFDSKLFNETVEGCTPYHILTCLIYDVEAITNTKAVDCLKGAVDNICYNLNIDPHYITSDAVSSVFKFCAEESLYQLLSVFNTTDTELVLASEILRGYGLVQYFEPALEYIHSLRSSVDKESRDKAIMLNWFFHWSRNATNMDMYPIVMLRKCIDVVGSSLFKSSIYFALKELNSPNLNTYIQESSNKKKRSLIANIKYNGMKSLEDDIYEYAMRVKNIDDESSAIHLMRQLNNRMGIINDYLYEEELTEQERKHWEKLYDKYDKVREEMVKKPIYSRKMYGLFVDYNALMNMSTANQMTMNTMY